LQLVLGRADTRAVHQQHVVQCVHLHVRQRDRARACKQGEPSLHTHYAAQIATHESRLFCFIKDDSVA
jgi:hypothetical protein